MLPKGTAAELLPQLVTESAGLSALIVDGGDKIANVERMEALWAAVSAEVTARDRDLANSIGAEIVKSRAAGHVQPPGLGRQGLPQPQGVGTGVLGRCIAAGSAVLCTIVRCRRASCQGHVEPQSLLLFLDDDRRLDDHDAVQFETLQQR